MIRTSVLNRRALRWGLGVALFGASAGCLRGGFETPESCVTYYADSDGDGLGDPSTSVCQTSPPEGYVEVEGDCDDSSSLCGATCDDADGDSVWDCRQPCADVDGDGYGVGATCTGADCDDGAASCTDSCEDLDTDGLWDCRDDCVDGDNDGYGVDGGDGTCLAADCDDTSGLCTTTCIDADSDTIWDCRQNCDDPDGDGYGVDLIPGSCFGSDCDETSTLCAASCDDLDADGTFDCKDDCIDVDGDTYGSDGGGGICALIDCDDTSTACTAACDDVDADGTFDCKDDCLDADGDGFGVDATGTCSGADCDDGAALCAATCVDVDTDGTFDCTDDCIDPDGDGWGLLGGGPGGCPNGIAPPVTISLSGADPFDFGQTLSAEQVFTMTNDSPTWDATGVEILGLDPPFALVWDAAATCPSTPFTLAGASTCDFKVAFTPTAGGDFTDVIEVSFNDGYGAAMTTKDLAGSRLARSPDPSLLQAVPDSSTQITLNWVDGGGTTTGFIVAHQAGGALPVDCSAGTTADVGMATSYPVSGLTADTVHAFRVCSYNVAAQVSAGIVAQARTPDAGGGFLQDAVVVSSGTIAMPVGSCCDPSTHQVTTHGTDRLLVVSDHNGSPATDLTAVRYGGIDLQFLARDSQGVATVGLWYLVDPPVGTHTLRLVNADWNQPTSYNVLSLAGVNQATPIAAAVTAGAASATPSVTVSSAVGERILSFVTASANTTLAPQSPLIGTYDVSLQDGWGHVGGSAHADGAASVVADWSLGTSADWITLGTSVIPIPAAPPDPTSFDAVSLTGSTAQLTWSSGGGTTADYRVAFAAGAVAPPDCASGTTISEDLITGTSHVATALPGQTDVSFRLCAITDSAQTAVPRVSPGITATSSQPIQTPPPEPSGLVAAPNPSGTQIDLRWTSGGGDTVGFVIAYQTGATAPADCTLGTVIPASSITGTAHGVDLLSEKTLHAFRVCATNGNPTPDLSAGVGVSETTWPLPVTLVNASSGVGDDNFSFDHTVSGTDRLLVVVVGTQYDNNVVVWVRYAGIDLTYLDNQSFSNGSNTEIWYLIDPPVGTDLVSGQLSMITMDSAAGAVTFEHVDPATPFGTVVKNGGNTITATLEVNGTPWDLPLVGISSRADTITLVSTADERFNVANTDQVTAAGYTLVVDGTVTLEWMLDGFINDWSALGVPINRAP